jgi:hypothetical protein
MDTEKHRLEHLADEFDRIHAEAQTTVDDLLLKRTAQWAGSTFGPDSLATYAVGILPVYARTIYTFAAGSGKQLVDTLRLGAGVRSGTLGGVGEDALRVLNIIPALGLAGKAAGGVGRAAMVGWASRAAGGSYAMSCGVTSGTVALRLSGTRMLMTLDKLGKVLGKGPPTSPQFPGVFWHELTQSLQTVGATVTQLNTENASLQAIERAALNGRGPVIFGVQWWKQTAGGWSAPLWNARVNMSAPDHFLVAFRNTMGRVLVADQFGVQPIANLASKGSFSIASTAYVVENVGFVRAMEVASAAGRSVTRSQWILGALGVETVVVSASTWEQLDGTLRQLLGRPPRAWPAVTGPATSSAAGANPGATGSAGQADGTIPAPATLPVPDLLSPTLQDDCSRILKVLPANHMTYEAVQVAADTKLPMPRVRNALLNLARTGLIRVASWTLHNGKPTPALVARTL